MRLSGQALGGTLLLLGLLTGDLAAQQSCDFLEGTGDYVARSGVTYIQTPRLRCRDGMRIVADSAVYYESSAFYQLFGRVLFENDDVRLRSGQAQFYDQAGRITAQEAVNLLRKGDSTLVTGANLEYLQVNSFRTQEQLTVTGGRPHALLHPQTRGAETPDSARLPYEVDADRIFVLGDEQFQANGTVEIHRGELSAFAQQVDYDGSSGQLVLRDDARVETESYDLSGDMVLLEMPGEEIREVVARENGVLNGEDLELRAPLIHLFVTDGALDRLVAVHEVAGPTAIQEAAPQAAPVVGIRGALEARERETAPDDHPSRPVAVAQGFTITADSLDVAAPGEVLETIRAMGTARAVSTARDSLNREDTPEIARRDWIAGDTVIATLKPVASDSLGGGEERREYTLERLVARIEASSLYRMPPSDTTTAAAPTDTLAAPAPADSAAVAPALDSALLAAAPDTAAGPTGETPSVPRMAVHYVKGDSITIVLENGQVASMEVAGQTSGIHLEPREPGRTTAEGQGVKAPATGASPQPGEPPGVPPPAGEVEPAGGVGTKPPGSGRQR